jgi:monofunctional glycosyltransferase
MLRFLIHIGFALLCFVGVVVAVAGGIVITTPNANDIKGCITAKMYNVPLCPGSANYVPLRSISPNVRHAVIVSEDSAFYQHNGFDLQELQNSIDENLKEGKIVRGGSTITQQLAKNVYLSGEKSFFRKMREALITSQLEKILKKDEILERYLNVVEFGPEVYGIKQASQYYFSKAPASLTVLEGAWLAFLLPNPKKYSQSYRKRELTKFARSQVSTIIKRMARFKKIPQDEADIALAQLENMFRPYVDPTESLSPEELATLHEVSTVEEDTIEEEEPTPTPRPADMPYVNDFDKEEMTGKKATEPNSVDEEVEDF